MNDFRIQNLPACRDYKGREHPQRFGLLLICSRGMRWDGGEFATRAEAVAEGVRRTGKLSPDTFLRLANAILPRTQTDPLPVTNATYAMARLRHIGPEGEALRQHALESGL